ncbi:MAG TPA: tyrosine-type recombinase/integrase [Mucilaginibacter sp.]|nr:tyrosine-type recombinase/integrase [Mucilaginibacter sp.]
MFLERFIHYIQYEKRYSPHTVSAYQSDLEQFFAFLSQFEISPDSPADVAYQHIRSWMVHLMEDKTARSVNRKIATLRKYFKFLLREGVITSNPASKIQSPKTVKHLPVVVEDEKLSAMLNDTEIFAGDFAGTRDKLVIEILFGTGIRLSELVGLKEGGLNLFDNTIKVLGKRNKERIVPVNHELKQLLEKYLELKKSENFNNNSLTLIVTNKGTEAYPKFIYLIVQRYLSHISTQDKKSPHVLRHTFATTLLNRGADLNAIKELLGHANLSATQVYTHNSVERLKSIYKQAHPKA